MIEIKHKKAFLMLIFLAILFLHTLFAQCPYTLKQRAKLLDSTLKANGVIHHKEFTYLAFHESGFQNANLFGMHHPYSRPTYSRSRYGQVAKFEHWQDAIRDFLIWYRLMPAQEGESFKDFLQKRQYSPCVECTKKLFHIIEINKFDL